MLCGKRLPDAPLGIACTLKPGHTGVCEATDASTGIRYAYPSPSDWGRGEAQNYPREPTADERLADLLESQVHAHGAGVDAALLIGHTKRHRPAQGAEVGEPRPEECNVLSSASARCAVWAARLGEEEIFE